jgi:hypothetical protein
LRGTAGSYGFLAVGEAAGDVEDALDAKAQPAALDPLVARVAELCLEAAGRSGSTRAPITGGQVTSGERLLLVERDDEVRAQLDGYARRQLMDVDVAANASEALQKAESAKPDAAIIDTVTEGYEFELVGNPTRNWTFKANYSHSERGRENFFEEGRTFFAQKFQEWRALAGNDAALRAFVEQRITEIQDQEIDDRAAGVTRSSCNVMTFRCI